MGMVEDPEDNAAVAASVFIAVAVYAVSKDDGENIRSNTVLTMRRVSLYFADFRLGYMFGRVSEGLFLCDRDGFFRVQCSLPLSWAY